MLGRRRRSSAAVRRFVVARGPLAHSASHLLVEMGCALVAARRLPEEARHLMSEFRRFAKEARCLANGAPRFSNEGRHPIVEQRPFAVKGPHATNGPRHFTDKARSSANEFP